MDINTLIERALTDNVFGSNFKFRVGQREAIMAIVNAYQKDPEHTVILDAPTGTGKSVISMWVAWLLKELGKQGYIVTSDLGLQDQYEQDFKNYNLRWPSIKGVDNYECHINGLPFSLGDCRVRNMGYERALKLPCAKNCDYLQIRKRALNHPITLVNYSFWLIQRNYVAERLMDENTDHFKKRDFAIFDEAHKVDEIVQSHFTPRIQTGFYAVLEQLLDDLSKKPVVQPKATKVALHDLIQELLSSSLSPNQSMESLRRFKYMLYEILKIRKYCEKKVPKNSERVPTSWIEIFKGFDRVKDVHCKAEDYIDLIDEIGLDKMVREFKEDEVRFKCIEESKMIQKYLHKQSGFKVFMSATIGDPRTYSRLMGIENVSVIRLKNGFNYEKSPIVIVNGPTLNMRNLERGLPIAVNILDKILEKHKGQRGIIHTGSYNNSNFILEHSAHIDRMVNYFDSKTKKNAIKLHKAKDDSVIIGPSILEGLDLSDNISRFQVFFKIPYPYLGDPLVKAKLKHMPAWYDWKTGVSIMQGVGRSIRSKDDWAITYIIDGSFKNLINKPDMFPPSFMERIKILK